jgi:hypothetical protein
MTLKQTNSIDWEGDSILIVQFGLSENGKTTIWLVNDKDGSRLGSIRWYAPWRKYAFYPTMAVLEQSCLRDIADFIDARTKEHKE